MRTRARKRVKIELGLRRGAGHSATGAPFVEGDVAETAVALSARLASGGVA